MRWRDLRRQRCLRQGSRLLRPLLSQEPGPISLVRTTVVRGRNPPCTNPAQSRQRECGVVAAVAGLESQTLHKLSSQPSTLVRGSSLLGMIREQCSGHRPKVSMRKRQEEYPPSQLNCDGRLGEIAAPNTNGARQTIPRLLCQASPCPPLQLPQRIACSR